MSDPSYVSADSSRALLRHTIATLAYRGGKAVANAPADVASFRSHETTRTPKQILAHICDVLDWGLALARGTHVWQEKPCDTWDAEVERFFASLQAFDAFLASDEPLGCPAEKLFQGPIADALTHVGQIAMLRRMAGSPIRGENYFQADVAAGRVGSDQSPPVVEFD